MTYISRFIELDSIVPGKVDPISCSWLTATPQASETASAQVGAYTARAVKVLSTLWDFYTTMKRSASTIRTVTREAKRI